MNPDLKNKQKPSDPEKQTKTDRPETFPNQEEKKPFWII